MKTEKNGVVTRYMEAGKVKAVHTDGGRYVEFYNIVNFQGKSFIGIHMGTYDIKTQMLTREPCSPVTAKQSEAMEGIADYMTAIIKAFMEVV